MSLGRTGERVNDAEDVEHARDMERNWPEVMKRNANLTDSDRLKIF